MITGKEPDYITLLDARFGRKCVVIMHYHKSQDEWVQTKVSPALTLQQAQQLAAAWAAARGLEIR